MTEQYNIYLGVDYMNTEILYSASSLGKLNSMILLAIDQGELASNGAVRLYRTSHQSYEIITQLMKQYHLSFHEAARPKEFANEKHTAKSA
ncbi:hypothetical protein KII91_00490 [Leuconostoc gelidum subsp. gelidum]|uniref:hypothetical protein n=1 Tax=Leuconostoc gelidum group TaxID=3016637 RepID=UPI0007E0BEDC|nr:MULTISPECIES: hypothetical protein [Leuconostoc gelidum group]MBZ5977821.1 hypothetical protein [Leuconostoc gelidum subsp. gelidum]MBZ6001858.1 hypothetical protein [Leuconostoc gelidum subsp. gelidum]CUW05991.1 hypothetical protein PB1E_1532 [Leuconostoc gasicomitatum]